MTAVAEPRFASPMEAGLHGPYIGRPAGPRFRHRIAETTPGRLHIYASWSSPGAHRAALVRSLLQLDGIVSISYVDTLRDARGWAFREATGPDPINGFTLLREAYERTQPDYDGPVTVPVLWDCHDSRILSNSADDIDAGLATAFDGRGGVSLYPSRLREQIDDLDLWLRRAISAQLGRSVYDERSRAELLAAFGALSSRLGKRTYLVDEQLTLADIRLWVSLIRYDAGPNAHGAVGPKLSEFPALWDFARRLYSVPAFRETTRFEAIAAPFATLPNW